MKAFFVIGTSAGTALEARERPVPEPGPGQILIRVKAASLNRGELLGAPEKGKPGGVEAAGEVVSVGDGVTGIAPGERIMARCGGGFAQYALVDAREAVVLPDGLSYEAASAIPIVYMVSYDMLVTYGHLAPGEWVVITTASSGVGVASLQLAKAMGAKVIGTSTSPAKLERLTALGMDAAICKTDDLAGDIKRLTGDHGADLSINITGGSVFPDLIKASAYRGRIAIVGAVDGVKHADCDLGAIHANRLQVYGVSNRNRAAAEKAESAVAFARDCLSWFADGTIEPLIDRVFDFDAALEAKAYFDRNQHIGKVVLKMPD